MPERNIALPIKCSNLNKKAAPPSVCRSFLLRTFFLFSGQLGIKGAGPGGLRGPSESPRGSGVICTDSEAQRADL